MNGWNRIPLEVGSDQFPFFSWVMAAGEPAVHLPGISRVYVILKERYDFLHLHRGATIVIFIDQKHCRLMGWFFRSTSASRRYIAYRIQRLCGPKEGWKIEIHRGQEFNCGDVMDVLMLYYIVLYCIVLYCIVLYCIVLYYIVILYYIILYYIILYYVMLCYVILYYVILYYIMLYYVILYFIVFRFSGRRKPITVHREHITHQGKFGGFSRSLSR